MKGAQVMRFKHWFEKDWSAGGKVQMAIIIVAIVAALGFVGAARAEGPPWFAQLLARVGLVEQANDAQDARIEALEERVALLEARLTWKCKKVTPELVRCQVKPGDYHISR